MKWQQFFEIQDGGDRHLEFLKLRISDVIDMIQIEVRMFSKMLVTIGQMVDKREQFFEIQDGGDRHLALWLSRFFHVTNMTLIKVAIFSIHVAMIGQ